MTDTEGDGRTNILGHHVIWLRHVEVLFVVRRRTLSLTASEPFRQIAESSQSLTVSLDLIRTSARKRNASRPHQAHLLTPKAFCHAVFGYRAY